MSPTVSCIIVNFNGVGYLRECLDSVLNQTLTPGQVIVVDNASEDGSADFVRSEFPQVELLALGENVGFAEGCNRGIRASHGDLVAILNNDLVLRRDWLENLLEQVREPWDFWASRIVFADAPDRIDSAGDGMAVVGAAYKIGHGDPVDLHLDSSEVFGPCAAAALYRRSLLEATGGFDPEFFLIYEDADLNMRARLLGYRCLYVATAEVRHRVNTSIGAFSHPYVFFGHRNSEFVFWQNMPALLLTLYLPERLLFNLLAFLYFTGRGRGGSYLKAKWDFLRRLPRVLEKRRRVQGTRRLSWREVNRLLDRNWLRYRGRVVAT